MSNFWPTRTSPPSRPLQFIPADVSRSSAVSVPELTGLTPEDVRIIDAVIQRASPSATTFLAIFKAYNDILLEHGLDPHEVTYYGKLLKLGTLKAKTWGEKWRIAKIQLGYRDGYENLDIFPTLHHPSNITTLPSQPLSATTSTNSLGLDIGTPGYAAGSQFYAMPPVLDRNMTTWDSETSEDRLPSSTLPSYHAAVTDTPSYVLPRTQSKTLATPGLTPSVARQAIAQARERKGSVINEEDAWQKIKMLQDEKEADIFREDKLVERCWEVWRQSFHWIHTTNEQIDRARDTHLVRLSIHRWRTFTASRMQAYERIANLANNRSLKATFHSWAHKLKAKRQVEWQNRMRMRMKIVRGKREEKLRKDAWAKWRQSYRSHLSGQHYTERLILRFYRRWKENLSKIDHMEAAADEHLYSTGGRIVGRCWRYWRKATEIMTAERRVTERISMRVMGEVVNVWRKHLYDIHTSDAYYDLILKKTVMRSWKAARDRIRSLNHRALKHLTRQDIVLMSAITRVWKARERGKLLERVKMARLAKDSWMVWTQRLQGQRRLEGLAIAFSLRSNSCIASSILQTWRQVYATHRNANTYAVQYYFARLRFKLLLIWRIQLRSKIQLAKRAKIAEKFFTTRRAWKTLTAKFESRKRQRKLQEFERWRLRKCFQVWLQRSRQEVQRKLAEQKIHCLVDTRILKSTLAQWTNRVINVKLRELEITQRNEHLILVFAFKKWKAVCVRHVEQINLLESYQFVKREENIKRIFHHWMSAARASRHRRMTLQHKEDEIKHEHLALVWDRWRDRYSNERLRPIECVVITQGQNNLLFRTFGIWHSKTRSLPAIRFHASRLKAKFWRLWRGTMPRALQAKEAREMYRRSILSKALDKWLQTYKTKIALKAVARARYLRLPTTAPRAMNLPQPICALPMTPKTAFSRKVERSKDSALDVEAGPSRSPPPRLFPHRTSLFATRPRSETGLSCPVSSNDQAGQPSPTHFNGLLRLGREQSPTRVSRPRSVAGSEEGKNRLWLELKEVQRKSRPLMNRSRPRSREPP